MAQHAILTPYLNEKTGDLDLSNADISHVLDRFTSQLGQYSYMINKVMATVEDVAAHGLLFEQAEAAAARVQTNRAEAAEPKRSKEQPAKAPPILDKDYEEYVKLCQERKNRINAAREEWRKAISDATAAKAAWDNYVREMRLRFDAAKAAPVPTRVVR